MSTPETPQGNGRSQRVFTESDEIQLLQSFRKISTTRSPASASLAAQITTVDPASISRINASLGSKFTNKQVNQKLRRLRDKYHKLARSKSFIKTAHDRKLYDIARGIWGKNTKTDTPRKRKPTESLEVAVAGSIDNNTPEEEEEDSREGEKEADGGDTAKGSLDLEDFPALLSAFSRFFPENPVWKEGMKLLGETELGEMNEKWMILRMEEAKLMAKKAELVQEQSKVVMEAIVESSKKD